MSNADQTDTPSVQPDDVLAHAEMQSEQADVSELQAQIAELEAEIKNVQARSAADMYNFQKRMERETDNAKKYALEKFAGGLLDVVDNLERAIAAAGDDTDNAMLEGVKLTHKSLLSVLEKHQIVVVDPVGQAFNADLHQAVGIAPDAPANQVGVVLQKGYTLSGRLLRPAMVMVGQ